MQIETYSHKGALIHHPLSSKPTVSFSSLTYQLAKALIRAFANGLESFKGI